MNDKLIGELIRPLDPMAFRGNMDIRVSGICYDSRQVKPGDLFVAIKGFKTDGHQYLKDAMEKGACAAVLEDKRIWEDSLKMEWMNGENASCLVSDSRLALAFIADEFYGHPSQQLHVAGVTGTNGKTTTCALISKILEASGEKVGWMNTLDYRVDREIFPSQRTTPESLDLHRMLHQMVNAGCQWAVVEVSSHSLVLDRVAGCAFDAAVLTNITQDHLDFHISQDEYCKAKARLFEMLDDISSGPSMDKVAIFNMDDPASRKILETRQSKGSVRASTFTYGLEYEADVTARDIQDQGNGLEFTVITPWGTSPASSPLMGRPNIYNILAAISMTMAFGMGIQDILEGLELMRGVPGRFEKIRLGQDFDVVIDYAHTDDALSNLLSVLRRHTHGRIICVFGCGGDRDKGKRPLMGKAAAMGSDWSIITSDNPRSEDPEKIVHEIEEGFLEKGSKGEYEICMDRKDAIYRAVDMARSGDMVVIAGKGHEKVQIVGSEEFPFDDQEVAKQAIQAVMAEKLGK